MIYFLTVTAIVVSHPLALIAIGPPASRTHPSVDHPTSPSRTKSQNSPWSAEGWGGPRRTLCKNLCKANSLDRSLQLNQRFISSAAVCQLTTTRNMRALHDSIHACVCVCDQVCASAPRGDAMMLPVVPAVKVDCHTQLNAAR